TEADLLGGGAAQEPLYTGKTQRIAFLDPSFTHDGDRCPVIFADFGPVNGRPTLTFRHHVMLVEDARLAGEPRACQIGPPVRQAGEKEGVPGELAALDSTAGGKPFLSIVHQTWSNRVTGIEFGGAASDYPVFTHDKRPASELYQNRVSEIWVAGR